MWEGRVYSEASSLVSQEATISLRRAPPVPGSACTLGEVGARTRTCGKCERERGRENERSFESESRVSSKDTKPCWIRPPPNDPI